jgi:5-methylcytosine-specific restriction endonuclease McrA
VKARSAAYYAANLEKVRARQAAYHAANPEKFRARNRRRRARKACAVSQRWVRRADHDDALCYWCGSVDVEHVDHVHPISLGGPAVPSNEVPSCAPCNLSKKAKHPLVWLAELMEQT